MYQIVIYLYLIGVAIASLFSKKVKKMWAGERNAIATIKAKMDPSARYVWFHAASLGEFEQGRPIMERWRKEHPEHKILLTFFSPSGYEVRKNYEGADIICYLPIDTIRNARRFLRTIRPEMAFFIKYEFWYNYLHILQHRGVPVYSVSSIFRKEQVFFRWYGKHYGRVLKCFTHFFVQNDISRELLAGIGITNVTVAGDTRFDRVLQIAEQSKTISEVKIFKDGKKAFIAGSSWQPDEEIFIPDFKDKDEWKLVIAPHVIGESHLRQIEQLVENSGRKAVRFTSIGKTDDKESVLKEASVLIIDCFGLLSSIYKYADIAYVGGGFGVGIHNLLEAAVWNVPVIFGPNHARFQEANELKQCGGGLAIDGADDFEETMARLADPAHLKKAADNAGNYVKSNAGATDKILSSANNLLVNLA